MTSYVTREEYDALNRRMLALERRAQETPPPQTIRVLISEGIAQAVDNQRRGGVSAQRYASQRG